MLLSHEILIKTGSVFFLFTAVLYNFNVFKIVLHPKVKTEQTAAVPVEKNMMALLKNVIDPEVEINIVDLGLIYNIEYNGNKHVDIEMTFSTKACPLGDTIVMNVIETINAKYPELEVNVQVVFDPPWSPERISEEGKRLMAGK